ncbi:MAG: class I SAM-dependent methyltransferase [Acetobacteraceae bacterium]|nr:class I SAM-dependent methyltransferase [Acetobacteraceae bacterium]
MALEQEIVGHYGGTEPLAAILAALRATGRDPEHPTAEDLAPIDEFHVRGREATAELGQGLGLAPDQAVLDIGSGLGGPSRHLAAAHGCHITGIDLTAAYVRAAADLAARTGLGDRVSYLQGSALALPFPDRSFDAAYTQHVAMNIADKPRLYAEAFRVLRPGGRFGLYDLLQGTGGEVLYPAPWAKEARTSFLATPAELQALLEGAGFEILSWRDQSEPARAWLGEQRRRLREGRPPPLGLAMLLGPDFAAMARNQARNLEEGRVIPTEVICRRR